MSMPIRKCDFTHRPIEPKDRASVQILFSKLDSTGRLTGENVIVDVCGAIRQSGEIDKLLTEYVKNI